MRGNKINTVTKILNRSVVFPFYRQHAGAFLFLFFILFGIHPSFSHILKFHYALILSILNSSSFFFLSIGCWFLYGLKSVLFFRSCLLKEAYNFIYGMNAVSPAKRFFYLVQLNLLILAPVACYGLIILYIAIKNNQLSAGLLVIAVIAILILVTSALYYSLLKMAKKLQQVTRKKLLISLPKTLAGFVLNFILRKQFITLLIIKLLSFTCLYYFARTDASVFEERMLWLLFISLLIGHTIIIYRNFHFIETELNFYRNLPVRNGMRLLSLWVVYTVILLPEAWALRGVLINQDKGGDYIWLLLTGPSLLLLLHCLLYTEDMKMEEFLKLLFGVWIVFVFFSLSKNHWLLPVIAIISSTIIFLLSYSQYEKNTAIEGLE